MVHGFPALRRGIHHGVVAHRTARAEGRARHLRHISEYRGRHAAALEDIRRHEEQERSRSSEAQRDAAPTADEPCDEPGAEEARALTGHELNARLDAAEATDETSDTWGNGPDAAQYNADGAPQSRRVDGRPETPEDTEFFDLRESGYDGPVIFRDGHARRPNMDDPREAGDVATLDRMRERANGNGHASSGRQAGETTTTEGDDMSTMTGENTGYESVLQATEAYKQRAQEERDAASVQRAEAAAMRQAAENLTDGMTADEVDSQTIAEAAELQEAADAAESAAASREAAADRLYNAAETLARGLQSRHSGLAEAHQSAPVAAARREFYQG